MVHAVRASVRDVFIAFTERFEGAVPWLYADVLGLITIAYGNLVDPLSTALRLDLRRVDGSKADRSQITAEWLRVKGDPECAKQGHRYAERITSLRLTKQGAVDLAMWKADVNDHILASLFPRWDSWPACAQLALHSWGWACGIHAHFPKMFDALNAGDFHVASKEILLREYGYLSGKTVRNFGVIPRNNANRILLENAAKITERNMPFDIIDWVNNV